MILKGKAETYNDNASNRNNMDSLWIHNSLQKTQSRRFGMVDFELDNCGFGVKTFTDFVEFTIFLLNFSILLLTPNNE